PSLDVIPRNTVVHFHVREHPDARDGRTCGRPFTGSGIPDDSGYVEMFFEDATLAADCEVEFRLVVDGTPIVDTVAVRTFLPGPPHIRLGADIIPHRPIEPGAGPVGDEFQILGIVDVHGNSTQDWRVEAT